MRRQFLLLLKALLPFALAQSSTSSSSQSSSSQGTPTSNGNSLSTTTASSSSSAASATVSISLPPLVACSGATFSFTAPPVQKYVAVFEGMTGKYSIIEVIQLPDAYTPQTRGTFTWTVDMPVGMQIGFQLYVYQNSTSSALTATTQIGEVQAGTDTSCYGTNGAYMESSLAIRSFASSLDPNYKYSSTTNKGTSAPQSTSSGGGGHTNIAGPVAGGVVGGIAVICLVAGVLFWLKWRHERQIALENGSNWAASEKYGPTSTYPASMMTGITGGAGSTGAPWIPYDQFGNPLVSPSDGVFTPPPTMGIEEAPSPISRRPAAPIGTLPEPMDADEPARDPQGRGTPEASTSGREPSPGLSPFNPVSASEDSRSENGKRRLDDPSQFSPRRAHHHDGLDDPSSFSPAPTRQ
ncbi:hypothetical protein T439DRAFT_358104 [Meredithblackwellia eburnea MCA 4105]